MQLRYRQIFRDVTIDERCLRFGRFGLVGISGLFVNLFLHYLFAGYLGFHYLVAALMATQGSTVWNFWHTERWVFGDRIGSCALDTSLTPQSSSFPVRFGLFLLLNNSTLLFRGPLMLLLTSQLGIHYLASNWLSQVVFMLLRYIFANIVIWKPTPDSL